jgi:hypothetical protein
MAVAKFAASLMRGEAIHITCFAPPAAAAAAVALRAARIPATTSVKSVKSLTAGMHAGGLALPGIGAAAVIASLQDNRRRQLSLQEARLTAPAGCLPAVRDFTAVTDVVAGILAALNATAATAAARAPRYVVYNLGRGQPVSTLVLLRYLEVLLKKQALSINCVMSGAAGAAAAKGGGSADVWATWADMSAAKQGLGFEPRVGLWDGLQEFAAWYMSNEGARNSSGASSLA